MITMLPINEEEKKPLANEIAKTYAQNYLSKYSISYQDYIAFYLRCYKEALTAMDEMTQTKSVQDIMDEVTREEDTQGIHRR